MPIIINTKRLTLKKIAHNETNQLTKHLNNWNIVKWLVNVPYPYKIVDAKLWIQKSNEEEFFFNIYINNSLIEAFEKSGLPTLPMGIQDIAIRDVVYSLRQSGRDDLLMNAAGQIAGSLNEVRPAGTIVEEIIREAIIILTRTLPETVEAGLD